MNISEDALKELVLRILRELQAENRKKIYMVCASAWDQRYPDFLKQMADSGRYDIYPVIPLSWQNQGYENTLRSHRACSDILYWEKASPADLETAVTVFPVAERTLIVKTALCISDTFETSWIADCIRAGSRIAFLYSGLEKFSGKEQPAYVEQVTAYYRQILEYGIEICGVGDLSSGPVPEPADSPAGADKDNTSYRTSRAAGARKRVITASNVEYLASGGVLYLQTDDIVTDMARERAKFLNIVLKSAG